MKKLKKKALVVLSISCSLVFGGLALAYAAESDEGRKNRSDTPGAAAADEQKLKEAAAKTADREAELNPKSDLEQFNEVFAGYKDLYAIESAHYADQRDSDDPAVQRVLHELEQKGKLIARFESALSQAQSDRSNGSNLANDESLLDKFYEETQKLNQELYPDRG